MNNTPKEMRPLESIRDTAAHTTLLPECHVSSLLSHSLQRWTLKVSGCWDYYYYHCWEPGLQKDNIWAMSLGF